jgi:hypothetical protein
MLLLGHQKFNAILLEARGPLEQLITSERSSEVAPIRFYVRYAWLVDVSMEVLDEQTD